MRMYVHIQHKHGTVDATLNATLLDVNSIEHDNLKDADRCE